MKIKFNIPMINNMKTKINNVKEKINLEKKDKVPQKYYALLLLMILLGTVTLSNNIKEYNESSQEDFIEYIPDESTQTTTQKVDVNTYTYETAESSISTNVANDSVIEVIETMSSIKNNEYIMPIDGEIIKEFAVNKLVYSKTLDMWKTHQGIDIKSEIGTEIKSSSNGEVISIYNDNFYGKTIKILDNNGYTFVYSNLDSIKIKEGDLVKIGQIIATVGVSAAGEIADEVHIHFEVIKDNTQINPLELITVGE